MNNSGKKESGGKKKPARSTHYVDESPPSSDTEYDMRAIRDKSSDPYTLNIELNNVPFSIISESTYSDIIMSTFIRFSDTTGRQQTPYVHWRPHRHPGFR